MTTYWAERRTPSLPPELLARIPDTVPRWKVAYWQFQHALTRAHLIPFLAAHDALPRSGRILEVGAGEGGCLTALTEATGLHGDGAELSEPRTALARAIGDVLGGGRLSFHVADITDARSLEVLSPPYGLVLLRDVIEHVEDRPAAFRCLRSLLADDGHLLATFPPYYSPFGAHQQVLGPSWLRLPWLQVLPFFSALVRRGEPNPAKRAESESIRRCALTMSRFERDAREGGHDIVARRSFLLRPAFRYRYGLPPVGAGGLDRLPGIRELLVTGAWYLARRGA